MKNIKSKYVSQFSQDLQEKVLIAITSALIADGLEGEELEQAIADAMDSRISDLENVIDIKKLF